MSHNKFRFKKADIGVFNSNSDIVADKLTPGCRILGLTRGKFSLIDLIQSILKKTGVSDVVVVTWSAGIKDAHQAEWMLNTGLIKSFTLVTDHSYATRQKKYALSIEALFGKENICTSEIHAKFVLMSNENWKICIRTSMNLNANKTCESFEIDDCPDIYKFYRDFVQHVFDTVGNGFQPKSWIVNKSLDEYFAKNEEKNTKYRFWTNE